MYSMFDLKQDFVIFSLNFESKFLVLKSCHVWCLQKMTLVFEKYFLGKISLINHHLRERKKKGEKVNAPLFFPNHPTPPKK